MDRIVQIGYIKYIKRHITNLYINLDLVEDYGVSTTFIFEGAMQRSITEIELKELEDTSLFCYETVAVVPVESKRYEYYLCVADGYTDNKVTHKILVSLRLNVLCVPKEQFNEYKICNAPNRVKIDMLKYCRRKINADRASAVTKQRVLKICEKARALGLNFETSSDEALESVFKAMRKCIADRIEEVGYELAIGVTTWGIDDIDSGIIHRDTLSLTLNEHSEVEDWSLICTGSIVKSVSFITTYADVSVFLPDDLDMMFECTWGCNSFIHLNKPFEQIGHWWTNKLGSETIGFKDGAVQGQGTVLNENRELHIPCKYYDRLYDNYSTMARHCTIKDDAIFCLESILPSSLGIEILGASNIDILVEVTERTTLSLCRFKNAIIRGNLCSDLHAVCIDTVIFENATHINRFRAGSFNISNIVIPKSCVLLAEGAFERIRYLKNVYICSEQIAELHNELHAVAYLRSLFVDVFSSGVDLEYRNVAIPKVYAKSFKSMWMKLYKEYKLNVGYLEDIEYGG